MQYPEATHCIVAKDLPQAKRGPLATLQGVCHDRGVDDFFYNQTTGEITFSNGCKIRVLSAAAYMGFRALEADTIWCDEVATWGPSAEEAFTKFLAATTGATRTLSSSGSQRGVGCFALDSQRGVGCFARGC
jgi:hypothetical protein